jgi:membrane protease YdiL (CAAX protease family)
MKSRGRTSRLVAALVIACATAAAGQEEAEATAATPAPPPEPEPSDVRLPLLSVLLPGYGQYAQGAQGAGLAFSGAFVAGAAMAVVQLEDVLDGGSIDDYELPAVSREREEQVFLAGLQLTQSAGFMSAYDSFHRSLPALQRRGRYTFLKAHEPLGRVFAAPFDLGLIRKKTVWMPLAGLTLLAGGLVAATRHGEDDPFARVRSHDVVFGGQLSYQAGVAEEALFRGYLLPVLQQQTGEAKMANIIQAAIFGGLHYSKDNPVPVIQTALGFLTGAVAQKRGGSIREGVFLHFWWDVAAVTAELLVQKSASKDRVLRLPTIHVRF